MKGKIFNIQRFSINDGPSVRTAVFFKGCPLRCLWCHNPEGISPKTQLSFMNDKCAGCMNCEKVCREKVHSFENGHLVAFGNCIACGKCAENCASRALEIIGREYTVSEVMEACLRDRLFYNDGGGVTFTGGEPLMQEKFALSLAKALKEEGVGLCIETSGYVSETVLKDIAPYTDMFLFDIKETDEKNHIKYTGVGMERIHKNLHLLDSLGAKILLRCPVIPGVNDRKEHFDRIGDIAESIKNAAGIELEPYHPFGIEKNRRIGQRAGYEKTEFMQDPEIEKWRSYMRDKNITRIM